jgi:hypothetical protein
MILLVNYKFTTKRMTVTVMGDSKILAVEGSDYVFKDGVLTYTNDAGSSETLNEPLRSPEEVKVYLFGYLSSRACIRAEVQYPGTDFEYISRSL